MAYISFEFISLMMVFYELLKTKNFEFIVIINIEYDKVCDRIDATEIGTINALRKSALSQLCSLPPTAFLPFKYRITCSKNFSIDSSVNILNKEDDVEKHLLPNYQIGRIFINTSDCVLEDKDLNIISTNISLYITGTKYSGHMTINNNVITIDIPKSIGFKNIIMLDQISNIISKNEKDQHLNYLDTLKI